MGTALHNFYSPGKGQTGLPKGSNGEDRPNFREHHTTRLNPMRLQCLNYALTVFYNKSLIY